MAKIIIQTVPCPSRRGRGTHIQRNREAYRGIERVPCTLCVGTGWARPHEIERFFVAKDRYEGKACRETDGNL